MSSLPSLSPRVWDVEAAEGDLVGKTVCTPSGWRDDSAWTRLQDRGSRTVPQAEGARRSGGTTGSQGSSLLGWGGRSQWEDGHFLPNVLTQRTGDPAVVRQALCPLG